MMNILISIAILFAAWVLSYAIIGMIQSSGNKVMSQTHSESIVVILVRIVVFSAAIMVVLRIFNVSIAPMLTALGIGGLAMALALQDPLSNLFFGIQLIASQKIRPTDYIKLATGEEGYVSDISWHNTTITTAENNLLIVPNSKIASASVTNYHLPNSEIVVKLDVPVCSDNDLRNVKTLAMEAAMSAIPAEVKDSVPTINYSNVINSNVIMTVIMRVSSMKYVGPTKDTFITELYKKFKDSKIKMPIQ